MKNQTIFPSTHSNINQLWASIFIEELIRHGITEFCIAPGSRSTPLTLAIANHAEANTHIHFDERGLGFLAIGLSQASQKPVVIVTTSGTAVANLYPAVIEARQSSIPLIIISADRPAELLNCGANQAIEQHRIFANYPVFFTQIVQPTTEIKANYLLTTIDHGLNQQHNQPGPIHFNIAFAEPLYPNGETLDYFDYLSGLQNWRENNITFTQYINSQGYTVPECSNLSGKKILVVIAKMQSIDQARAITLFCKNNNIALLTDIQSSQSGVSNNLSYYDLLLINDDFKKLLQQADIIIQFGEQIISKRLATFIANFEGESHLVNQGTTRIDPDHQLDKRFICTATQWITAQQVMPTKANENWHSSLQQAHDHLSKQIIKPFINNQPYSEMSVIKQLDTLLIKNAPLFIGNSMPIRFADMLMSECQSPIFTNRGASGIDGLLASAIGVAKKSSKVTTLLIGDSSFLYDLNSLSLLKQLATPFIIVLINNDGGAIFNLLPVPEEQKKNFYQLPHGLNFKASCEQFGIDYYNPNQEVDFKDIYTKCLQGKHSLIEITLPNQQSATQLEQLKEQIQDATL
ncbi:2-succinyl-5-enolpyruvyl-6-hydroxy-3-cyclohexene- 1-carboxylate synthase [Psychromonas marina]|uniref:2-succinyl-5-enolpyruvyl-6-hydroxy-3-cyclohexene-1-carboxylate synthase n=1 Tax=Psychromonas marina TaxID=88364 RepID=A0ABQ6E519_9GAMM|nr:2-succinyl-5-enolpyruvyl-6-hydroxy-3-cyclohexene-1-carboxylic-acid synthase [Psychromonas marina]GLS92436.1 2-succinyl-5-enolpyruvyl-6-hydroxy-3-cyclohexene- 1-carboxylate synthase [Psychromonas marina]